MPDKHEVGGSSPLGPTSFFKFRKYLRYIEYLQNLMKVKFRKMFIENRISIEINEKHENRKLSNVKLINREKDKF